MPHIHEKIDYCADVYVVNDGAVLLRFHDKYDMWLPPGGHIELDEDPEEAAIREAQEEAGLSVKLIGERFPEHQDGEREVLPPRSMNRHHITDTHEHINLTYFGTSTTRQLNPRKEEKEVAMRWFTREELGQDTEGLIDRVRMYALAALAAAGY